MGLSSEVLEYKNEVLVDFIMRHGYEKDLTADECDAPRIIFLDDTKEFIVARGDGTWENVTREVKNLKTLLQAVQKTLGTTATVTFVNEAIAKAQLEGAGVDTSNFVMQSELSENSRRILKERVGEYVVPTWISGHVAPNGRVVRNFENFRLVELDVIKGEEIVFTSYTVGAAVKTLVVKSGDDVLESLEPGSYENYKYVIKNTGHMVLCCDDRKPHELRISKGYEPYYIEEIRDLDWKKGYIKPDRTIQDGFPGYHYVGISVKKGEKFCIDTVVLGSAFVYMLESSSGEIWDWCLPSQYKGKFIYEVMTEGILYISRRDGFDVFIGKVIDSGNLDGSFYKNILGWRSGYVYSYGDSTTKVLKVVNSFPMYQYLKTEVKIGDKFLIKTYCEGDATPIVVEDSYGKVHKTIDLVDGWVELESDVVGTLYVTYYESNDLPVVKKRVFVNEEVKSIVEEKEKERVIKPVICWGDSLTHGSNGGYVAKLQKNIANPVVNMGVGGENVFSIASRQGGRAIYVKPFTIPSETTSVDIELFADYGEVVLGGQGYEGIEKVWIKGVCGNIRYDSGLKKYSFVRESAGSQVVVTTEQRVLTNGMRYKGSIVVIWVGTNNNLNDESSIDTFVRTVKSMIDYNGGEAIVLGLTYKGKFSNLEDINRRLAEEFGYKFIDIGRYLRNYGLALAGVEETEGDTVDLENGEIPRSLRSDSVHLNDAGYGCVASCVYETGKSLGYWN